MNTKKLIAIILSLVTVLVLTAACGKNDEETTTGVTEKFTDADGNELIVSVEYVTDENGNNILDENLEPKTTQYYYVEVTDENGEAITDKNNEKVTIEYNTGAVEVTLPEGKPVQENKRLLEKAFSSGKFYVQMTSTMIPEPSMPSLKVTMKMTIATNGTDVSYTADVNAAGLIKMGMGALLKDGKGYMLDTREKKYCAVDAATSGGINADELLATLGIQTTGNYIKSTEVQDKGKTYICEEYKTDFGVSKYYFDKNTEELKRIEHEKAEIGVIVVDKFVKNPDSSYFAIPSGYKQVSQEEFAKSYENMLGSLPF